MCNIKGIHYVSVHYAGQEPADEERFELADGSVASSVSDEQLAHYVLYLEEQLSLARTLQEAKEQSNRRVEAFFHEIE